MPNLRTSRIDARAETAAYAAEVLASQPDLDAAGRALLEEDLRSPCTEEIAVFRALARVVADGVDGFVVIDTAPTGHTILLLDAAGSYHREVTRTTGVVPEAVRSLLPRLRDPAFTKVILVTLPEATPVHEASHLQDDLRRAGIEPFAWVVTQCLTPLAVRDPVLVERKAAEARRLAEVRALSPRVHVVPWMADVEGATAPDLELAPVDARTGKGHDVEEVSVHPSTTRGRRRSPIQGRSGGAWGGRGVPSRVGSRAIRQATREFFAALWQHSSSRALTFAFAAPRRVRAHRRAPRRSRRHRRPSGPRTPHATARHVRAGRGRRAGPRRRPRGARVGRVRRRDPPAASHRRALRRADRRDGGGRRVHVHRSERSRRAPALRARGLGRGRRADRRGGAGAPGRARSRATHRRARVVGGLRPGAPRQRQRPRERQRKWQRQWPCEGQRQRQRPLLPPPVSPSPALPLAAPPSPRAPLLPPPLHGPRGCPRRASRT